MIFPIGDDNIEQGRPAIFSYGFMALNLVVFLVQISFPTEREQAAFVMEYAAIPAEISRGIDLQILATSIFLHGSWLH